MPGAGVPERATEEAGRRKTLATWVLVEAWPLLVTTALRSPRFRPVMSVMESEVAVAEETVPVPAGEKAMVLLEAVGSKPKPLTVRVLVVGAMMMSLKVMTGRTVATWTGAPLEKELVVTTALRGPARRPLTERVKEVAVEAVTVPVPVGVKTTELFPGVVSKLVPVMVRVVALAFTVVVAKVTVGVAV